MKVHLSNDLIGYVLQPLKFTPYSKGEKNIFAFNKTKKVLQ